MTVKEKLKKYDLFDQAIIKHGIMEYIRDYEILGILSRGDFDLEVQYIFKGCIKADYKVNVSPQFYSMDDKLLDLDMQGESGFPTNAFIWGVKAALVYPGLTLIENETDLLALEKEYGIKFYVLKIETNTYDLTLTFHDIEINELKIINKMPTHSI